MSQFSNRLTLLVILLFALVFGGEVYASPPKEGDGLRIVLHPDGIEVYWSSPSLVVEAVGDGRIKIVMEGFDEVGDPGQPQLPMASALIALPPGSHPTLEYSSDQNWETSLSSRLALNPFPDGVIRDSKGMVISTHNAYRDNEKSIQKQPVELEILGVVRGVHLARLVYYPVILVEDSIQVFPEVHAVVHFNTSSPVQQMDTPKLDDFFESLKTQVINPEQLKPVSRLAADRELNNLAPGAVTETALIEVVEPGITKVSYQGLQNALFPVSQVDPNLLQLRHGGSPVDIEWVGDSDSTFETGEYFLFFAEPRPSKWTDSDYYVLTEEEISGSRIAIGSGDPSGLSVGQAYAHKMFEQNNQYISDIKARPDGDHWYWDQFSKPDDTTGLFDFNLPNVNVSGAGLLDLWLVGYTDVLQNPDHLVAVDINGTPLSPVIEWNGKQLIHVTLDIPVDTFETGINQLGISLPGIPNVDVEGMWLDVFSIDYPLGSSSVGDSIIFSGDETQHSYTIRLDNLTDFRVYDVTAPENPQVLLDSDTSFNKVTVGDPTGGGKHRYIVSNQSGMITPVSIRLKSPLSTGGIGFDGAEYLVITHPDFSSALSPLLDFRSDQGLSVAIEDVFAVYDNYNDGRMSPSAIKDYLRDAYTGWEIPPLYILLVGDGTYDPKHYQLNSFNTYIPPYLANVDPWLGETAADNRYVTLDGDDIIPDMLIGRLSVNSLGETQVVVDKILSYEASPIEGEWNQDVTFVTDDPDSGGDFSVDADYLADNSINDVYNISKIYHVEAVPPEDTQLAILNNWNNGPGMMTYIGHGSQHTWGGESLFHINTIQDLTNGGRLPILIELTCLTGAFQTSGLDVIDENLLRAPSGGAVAVWGPTGFGLARGHVPLAEGFLDSTYNGSNLDLGLATLLGKINLLTREPSHDDLVDTFTLFGDPALNLYLELENIIYIPLVLR